MIRIRRLSRHLEAEIRLHDLSMARGYTAELCKTTGSCNVMIAQKSMLMFVVLRTKIS